MGGDGRREASELRTASKIALASLSAAVAETSTFPIDIIKTRLQLHGESPRPTSLLRPPVSAAGNSLFVAAEIWKKGGVLGFYNGHSPALLRHLFYTPLRIVGYEHLRAVAPDGSLLGKALAGGVSGVIAQILASPADLIKVRMQADGHLLNAAAQPRYVGVFDALRKIVKKEGIRGLWTGVFPNAQRAFLVNMGELTCYDQAKHFIIRKGLSQDNTYAHTMA